MEWKQILIEDVVFLLHEVQNDGSYDYDQVAFGYWLANCVGGHGDCDDDVIDFDLVTDIAWSLDDDNIGGPAFGTDPVGVGATSFIETPGNDKDRIDNDSDGETGGPIILESMIVGEILGNGIDDNGNALIDENLSHVPVGDQLGVGYADRIDNNGNGEAGSPLEDFQPHRCHCYRYGQRSLLLADHQQVRGSGSHQSGHYHYHRFHSLKSLQQSWTPE